MADMKISHFVVILYNGQLFAPNLVRAVPAGMEDDTQMRVSLMGMLGTMVMGNVCPLENLGQIWSFWENHAAPSGFELGIVDIPGREAPAAPPSPPTGTPPGDASTTFPFLSTHEPRHG